MILILGVLAAIFGLISASQIKNSAGALKGLGMARAGWILGVMSLLGFGSLIGLIAVGAIGDDASLPGDLVAGDCVDLDENAEIFFTVPTVECSSPHNAEVILVGSANPSGDRVYPGEDALNDEIYDTCLDAWPGYVGVEYEFSELGAFWFLPDKSRWARDDGEFRCFATSFERTLVESIRDSGR